MKAIRYLFLVSILMCNLGCGSSQNTENLDAEKYQVISAYFNFNKGNNPFVKSIKNPSFGSTLKDLIKYSELNNSHNLIDKSFGIKFEDIFPQDEIEHLKYQAENVPLVKLKNEILRVSKKMDANSLAVTVPILSKDGQYAIMYVEGNSGGDLFVLKKIDNEWTPFSILSVWVS